MHLFLAHSSRPDAAEPKVSGPRKIVEVDGIPHKRWRVDDRCTILLGGRLWVLDPVGCLLCLRDGANVSFTLVSVEPPPVYHCTEHGGLIPVSYVVTRSFVVEIGTSVAEGAKKIEDYMLVPKEMLWCVRNVLIQSVLAEAESYEAERLGP